MKRKMMDGEDGTDAQTLAMLDKKNPRRSKFFSGAVLLMKVAVGVGGIIIVTKPALFWAEPPVKSRHVEHNGREQLARTPGRSQLRGVRSPSIDEKKDTAEVVDHRAGDDLAAGAGAGVAQAAPTPRRLRMLPMEGRWGEWFTSPIAGSDENETNGEKPGEGRERENEGFKDWLITHTDADDYPSDYYGDPSSHLKDAETTGVRSGKADQRWRERRGDEEEKLKRLGARYNNDDDDMFGDIARAGYHSRLSGRIVPGRGWGQAANEGGIDAKSERSEPRQNDGHVGTTSKGVSDTMERGLDNDFKTAIGSDAKLDAREHDGGQQGAAQEEAAAAAAAEEEMDWSTDDDGVMHYAHTTHVPTSNSRPAPGALLPPSHDQLDERDGLWAAGNGGEEELDFDGRKRREQGILSTNVYLKPAAARRKKSPSANEADEVLLGRRRYRRPDEDSKDGDDDKSSAAWSRSGGDAHAPAGSWDTDDDFFIHVAHYSSSRAATKRKNQDGTRAAAAAAEPAARRRRQWERARESLWDTEDNVSFHEEEEEEEELAHHRPGAARDGAVNGPAAAAAAMNKGKGVRRTWESWVTDESDDLSLYDVAGAPSKPSERGQKQTGSPGAAEKPFYVEWQFNDDFENYDHHTWVTSGSRDGGQEQDVTDDWELDGGTHFSEEDPILAATKEGRGGHASAAEEEKEDEEAKGPIEPYSEYYSYLAEMQQLLQLDPSGRVSAHLQHELQPPPSTRHRMKTATSSAVDAEQRERPVEEQEEEWGCLGLFMKPLLDLFSAGEQGGALGFLEALLPRKPSNSRDEASSIKEKARTPPNKR